MKSFINNDFLLTNEFAKVLYHDYAKKLPIIDYHCHLSSQSISENRKFENLTSIWLEGDHYKWRAMRTLGINENFITGSASPKDKFDQWAYTVPFTVRNPLYHWTHLELKRYFDIDVLLNADTAAHVFGQANTFLSSDAFSTRSLLRKMNVEVVCTTDDPVDTLSYHEQFNSDEMLLLPAFRPDKAYAVGNPTAYLAYLERLSQISGTEIHAFDDLLDALKKRIDFFHHRGCRLSDHGMERIPFPADGKTFSPKTLFKKILQSELLSPAEIESFKYSVLLELCRMYHEKNWTQQFHLGALRNTNERMLRTLGPDTGFDSIGDFPQATSLGHFLNELDKTGQLAKTILYNLNPSDNEIMATMIGNFNDGSIKGKIQFGSGWWFLDQKDGMEKQLNALSNLGLLSCFVGMLTDSRSFLSFPRHEYFRRILCNMIGKDVAAGELPEDEKWFGKIVSDICYNNAKEYFQFDSTIKNTIPYA